MNDSTDHLHLTSEQYGVFENGAYVVPAYWQSLWNAIPQLTTGLGAWLSGPISDRFGRRWSLFIAGLLSVIGVAIVYTSSTPSVFLVGKMINSLGLGAALSAGQTYISEITPRKIRGISLAVYTVCLSVGYLIAASVAFTRVTIMEQSSYKLLFASEWSWPAMICLGAFLIPESPYFLVRKDKLEKAGKAVSRLHRHWNWTQVLAHVQTIKDATEHEVGVQSAESSFADCFRGTNWRRTRIVLYSNGLSQMVGAVFLNNAPYFMVLAGLAATEVAMMIEIGIAMSIFSSILTLWAMARIGRRPIVLFGIGMAAVLFFIMGVSASVPHQSPASLWAVAITLQMAWLSIGPANGPALAVAAEVGSINLRAKTLAIGFFFNYAWSAVWNIVVPYMFNPGYGDLGGLMGWVFFGTSIVSLIIMWLELPETKDMSFQQIDLLFETKVNARKFKSAEVHPVRREKEIEMENIEQLESTVQYTQ